MNDVITIKNKRFIGNIENGVQSNALGFMWRPGMPRKKIRIDNCHIEAGEVAEGLKLSNCSDVVVTNTTIIGGFEDVVDIVRGDQTMKLYCCFLIYP